MKKIGYKVLADFLLALHLIWIGVLLGGTIYIFFNKSYITTHIIIVSGTLLFNLFLGGCPLTWWEEKVRKVWDPRSYYHPNSFLVTYVHRVWKKEITPQQVNWVLVAIKVFSYMASVLLLTGVI
ncbi:MAG: DUF2784 family protein [Candidatus Yanofskybacteria bacterium]|nr:DUF2784 family protein [Candidatus Yanofskybacteria bacterium]